MSAIHVIATTLDGTRAALAAAVPLAKGSDARLVVLVPRIVSGAEELATPCEAIRVMAESYQRFARELGAEADVEICSSIGLDDLVAKIGAAHSQVVVGGPVGHWLTSPEERFTNRLARAGCQVVFAASGINTTQRRVAA
jgi:hypothetical protein